MFPIIFCLTRGGVFVNITKFKVPVLPLCHLIVPENGWRIVCSGLKKAAANVGSLGAENQYYPPFCPIKPALAAYGKVKGIFFVICLPSCLNIHTRLPPCRVYHIFGEFATMSLCQIFIIRWRIREWNSW